MSEKAVLDKLGELDRRFDNVESRLDTHDEIALKIFKKLDDHDQQFIEIRREMKEGFALIRDDILRSQDLLLTRIVRLETDHAAALSWIRRVEEKTDHNTVRIDQCVKDIGSIKRYLGME